MLTREQPTRQSQRTSKENAQLGHPRQTRRNRSRPPRAPHQELLAPAAAAVHGAHCLPHLPLHRLHLRASLRLPNRLSNCLPADPRLQSRRGRPTVLWHDTRHVARRRIHRLHPRRLQQKARRQQRCQYPRMASPARHHRRNCLLHGTVLVRLVWI